MNSFCVDTIPGNPHLRAPHGILRAAALPITADARHAARLLAREARAGADRLLGAARAEAGALAANARASADGVLADARAEAERLLSEAREQASRLSAAERQRVTEQAAELLQSLERANDAILERVQDIVTGLAHTLYDRLVMETTPRERIDASLRRVLQEAPPKLVDAQLRAHPDDVALLPALDWPVKTDQALARGACRLEASNGQWCANFDLAVRDLKAAFAQRIEERSSDPS
ncbi:FliH/SctL family protein [Pseudoduganella namucuonensis]|uniref:Flagellar biosynthesis/type III secretory pathway protein FliH n=1 Tax=Pseudoduganella namucuonensis TaxID=1035707 RepID=A0A1I7LWD0_9BURK|nr:HrpE/YscL family type III secretion apparatus protein [Pseudoduganella namucuonensis]SFV13955.1 Flagellar biosynthesis/type III secretory pathway protein FliH [Pseudoduganella namucuonensis]